MKAKFFLIFNISSFLFGETSINELLKCNRDGLNVAAICDVENEMRLYEKSLENHTNYVPVPELYEWINEYTYPNIHPTHQIVLDIINELGVLNICEVGAGAGRVSKLAYAQNNQLNLTCIEASDTHLKQMKENFGDQSNVILPDIKVPATIIKGQVPYLKSIPDNSFDLVFTCTVMMHLPYIPAILSAQEMARLSHKYILHVENKNEGHSWYNMSVVNSPSMSSVNELSIDYVTLYNKLGYKTIKYFEYPDPYSPATFIVYLGVKG
jgi:ubiquinone/menaquinone biosynthesis C-methylase UbiE